MAFCHNMQDTKYCYLIAKCQNRQKLHLRGLLIIATLCFNRAHSAWPVHGLIRQWVTYRWQACTLIGTINVWDRSIPLLSIIFTCIRTHVTLCTALSLPSCGVCPSVRHTPLLCLNG